MKPVCDFVNAEVARLRNQTIAIGVICAVGAVLLPIVTGIGDPRIPLVLAGGITGFWFYRARAELAASCRTIAAKRLVAAVNRALSYKGQSSLTQQQFVAMDLFAGAIGRWKGLYEISASARDVRFGIHRVQAAGRERGEMIFDGVVIKIDFSDGFPGHTIVVPEHGQAASGRASPGTRVKRDLVLLKSPAFERVFSVYASDYFEARRLVTPRLMVLILEAAQALRTDLRLAFVQRSLFVAVPGEGLNVNASLFGGELTPKTAVGQLTHLVAFAEHLAIALAE